MTDTRRTRVGRFWGFHLAYTFSVQRAAFSGQGKLKIKDMISRKGAKQKFFEPRREEGHEEDF
jgi:hypothetical protein